MLTRTLTFELTSTLLPDDRVTYVVTRRAFCQAFCKVFNLKLATLDTALARGALLAAQSRYPTASTLSHNV